MSPACGIFYEIQLPGTNTIASLPIVPMALTQHTVSEVLGVNYLVFYLSLLIAHSKAGGVEGSR